MTLEYVEKLPELVTTRGMTYNKVMPVLKEFLDGDGKIAKVCVDGDREYLNVDSLQSAFNSSVYRNRYPIAVYRRSNVIYLVKKT